jgi:hypothetical protein
MCKKQYYTAPCAETFGVCTEGIVCQSFGLTGAPGVALLLDDPENNYGDF